MSTAYCKDCEWVLQWAFEVDVDKPGAWKIGPNDLMHFYETTRPSRKYPTTQSYYFLCGRVNC